MRLATFQPPGRDQPLTGEVLGDRVVAFADGRSVIDVLAEGGRGSAGPAPAARDPAQRGVSHQDAGAGEWALSDVTLLAPIPEPGTIYAIGLNYASHVAEMGGTPPDAPIVFVKVRGSVAAPGGVIRCPAVVHRLDYEGELTVVIGAGGAIGGYCVANDVSARDLQGREPQWTRAKGADTFCPFGPWITTADEVPDPGDLRLRTWVNGELRQDSSTSDMIFSCSQLVDFIAATCTLRPGDLILTGTPSGVGMGMDPQQFLHAGDTVRIEIERLGVIEQQVG